MTDLRYTLEQAMDDYNDVNSNINLILFDDAIMHVARIVRIIKGKICYLFILQYLIIA